jgi:hypothetical protein
MCCANRRIISDCGFRVCSSCGTQDMCPIFLKPHAFNRAPARPPYSRKKRFQKLLFNVWSARLPSMKDAFVEYIQKSEPHTPRQIVELIRTSKNRSFKRYDCVSRLSREFLLHRIEPLTPCQIQECMGIFERVEITHRRVGGVFPAYSFLIEMALQQMNRMDLVKYLHHLKCPRRRQKYITLYGSCFHHTIEPIPHPLRYSRY